MEEVVTPDTKKEASVRFTDALRHVRLLPNAASLASSGAPVGSVDLLGTTLAVRCMRWRDARAVRAITGKDGVRGDVNPWMLDADQLVQIVVLALAENGTASPSREAVEAATVDGESLVKFHEVATCFLLGGAALRGSTPGPTN